MHSNPHASARRWLWLVATLVIGSMLTLFAASADGVSSGPRQLERSQKSWQVFDGRSIGQVLRIDPARMVGVRLWFGNASGSTGMLTASLYSFEHKRDIATVRMPIAAVRSEGATDIRFGHLEGLDWPVDLPLTVELRVATTGVAEEAALTAYGSINRYSNGSVVVNGKQRPSNDLAFAALYPGTWLDDFLPITHIAEFRPGVFGWPPLYGLLAWLVLWAALALFVAFARPRSGYTTNDQRPMTKE